MPASRRRLLVIFLDGVGGGALRRAADSKLLRFLPTLRDGRSHHETRAFSGMPSTTTSFQAGLFFGLRHPDVPAFGWLDRAVGRKVTMNAPGDAADMEALLRGKAGPGLFAGGTSYVSILAGGSEGALTTAGLGGLRERASSDARAPTTARLGRLHEQRADASGSAGLRAQAVVHAQTVTNLLYRLGGETPRFLASMAAFAPWIGSSRHEFNFLLNHIGVGTLLGEVARSSAILDLVRGVPRIFLNLHEYDEFSHRRGPRDALRVLRRIDREVEALFAIAAEVPNPPDVYVITDHGHIPSVPFERIFGCTIQSWLLGEAGNAAAPPLPQAIERLLGGRSPAPKEPVQPPTILDCGNYAHVYFGGDAAWDARDIAGRRAPFLSRALDCPGVGLVAMRSREHGPIAFAGGRRVDPDDPSTHPRGTSPRAIAALLEELGQSPAAGDLVLYGSWFDDACVAFSWEFSSHGGPSPEETETFVLHPAALDLSGIEHGADLHAALQPRYGADETHLPR